MVKTLNNFVRTKFIAFLYIGNSLRKDMMDWEYNKYRLGMLISVIISLAALILKLMSIVLVSFNRAIDPDTKTTFEK
jgi:hypothetical protein